MPALTCPDALELSAARGLPSRHSHGYASQSNPAFKHIRPALTLDILVQYAGYSDS